MRVKLVAGNWKMNGSLAANQGLLNGLVPLLPSLGTVKSAICAPFPYLAQVAQALKGTNIAVGAQDVCQFDNGAYTGGVSAAMLKDIGCRYVIVGHSERRTIFGESSELVALKFAAVRKAGLTPILCVGETLTEREAGDAEAVIARQLDAVIGQSGVAELGHAVVAYEPVWAIGTGKTATPDEAQAIHAFVRARIAAQDAGVAAGLLIQYGGSVKASNARQLFAMPDIDGGLIVGASLIADEFAAICRAA